MLQLFFITGDFSQGSIHIAAQSVLVCSFEGGLDYYNFLYFSSGIQKS